MRKFKNAVTNCFHGTMQQLDDSIRGQMPTATADFRVVSKDLQKADIIIDLLVTNRSLLPIPKVDVSYIIELNGREQFTGLIQDGVTIPAHGSTTISIPVTLVYREIMFSVKPGCMNSYRIKACLIINLPVLGRHELPVEKTGEIWVPYVPEIDLEDIQIEKVCNEEISATIRLKIDNKNEFQVKLNDLEINVLLSDVKVGGVKLDGVTIGKKCCSFMDILVSLRPMDTIAALLEVIKGKRILYSVKGNVDINTPLGPWKLPISIEG